MDKTITAINQKSIYKNVFLFCTYIVCTFSCPVLAQNNVDNHINDSCLQIYLPREVTMKDDILKLGRIGIIRGPEDLVAKASGIMMGRISVPGQEIVIENHVVLSRLAGCGIPTSQVKLMGAEKVTVKKQNDEISGDEFVNLAESFLIKNLISDKVSNWSPVRKPKDLMIHKPGKDIRFESELIQNGAKNQVKVKISVFSDKEMIGTRDITFAMRYKNHVAVAVVDIPAGTLIDSENVKIEENKSNFPEPSDWKPPYGLVAKRKIPAKSVIQPHMLDQVEAPVVIKRNQNVVIQIEKPGFLITALGKAMQNGKVGEYIKVRNIDSQRIIVAKVNNNGSVEPVF